MTPRDGVSSSGSERFATYVVPDIPALLRLARALTSSQADAEDLVQETLLRAFRGIEDFDGEHSRAWLFTIMRNANINRTRRTRPTTTDQPAESEAVPERSSSDPAVLVVRSEFDDEVRRAAARLPVEFRDVVSLVDFEGYSYAEVAATLGVPVGTVMSRLHRGRRRIRAHLIDRGLVPRRATEG